MVFGDPGGHYVFAERSWLEAAINDRAIEVVVTELDDAVRHGMGDAQARQGKVGPSSSE